MVIWEYDYCYGGEEPDERYFYATKEEAMWQNKLDYDKQGILRRHHIKPGRRGLVGFLNREFGEPRAKDDS